MAGAGYKSFTAGAILGASDVNTYLMQQTVMVFANATARDAALTAPSQGMVAYLKDEARVYQYTGSAWKPTTNFTTESGTATITTSGSINFTSGRFTQTPVVIASVASSATNTTSVTVASVSTTGVTFYLWSGAVASTTANRVVNWFAVQATA